MSDLTGVAHAEDVIVTTPGVVDGELIIVGTAGHDKIDVKPTDCDPDGIFATVHEDATGAPRVMFLLNPGASDVVARVTVAAPPATN